MRTKLPSQKELLRLLSYNPSTGHFIWLKRGNLKFDNRFAGKPALTSNWNGYKVGGLHGRSCIGAHRIAFKIYHGVEPDEVDHINGDRADNRIANLRNVTSLENKKNASLPRHNSSGVVGVCFVKSRGRWKAYVSVRNRHRHIGYFHTKGEAAEARKKVSMELGFHENHGRPA